VGSCTPAKVLEQIDSGILDPVYLLLGDDEYEKTELVLGFENTVDNELRPFNVDRFYGDETSLGVILDSARTFPMMSKRRIVVVFRAERAIQPKRENEATTGDLDSLSKFINAPPPHVTLIMVSGALDERRRLTKRLISRSTVVRCGQLETVSDAKRWIRSRIKLADKRMSDNAIHWLAEHIGPDSRRLRDELERLLLFCSNVNEITFADVRDVAGAAASYDDWVVTRAIEKGDVAAGLRGLGLSLEQGAIPYMILGQLAWVARSRLPAHRVSAAIGAVFRTDRDLKLSSGEPRILLERLVIELCGTMRRRQGSG